MNPGPTEEVGKVAGGFIDALKGQPLSLALVVMNVVLLGYLFYNEGKYVEARREFAKMLFDQQKVQSELLAKCVPVDEVMKLLQQQYQLSHPEAERPK